MSSTEYTDMANTISNNNTRCEHDVVLCDQCLIAAATKWDERTAEHNNDLNRMRDIHYSETQALRDELSAYRNTLEETRQSAIDAAQRMTDEHNAFVFSLRTEHANNVRAINAAHEAWKANLTEAAHEYANDNSLCGVFDQFMIDHGLAPRTREYEVEVDVEFRVRITVEGVNGDAAAEAIDQDEVDEAILAFVREHNASWSTGYVTEVRD